jgi:phosphoenolpyruvate carboxykinase (GTP)
VIFGGRRAQLVPLVTESRNWQHGVFTGARTGSETTAAAIHKVGVIRRDPMAMIPFCGYNMGDYFGHWLNVGRRMSQPPKIFSVNWFRVDDDGKFIWPGFGDNIRVLKWIIDRVNKKVQAKETAIGLVPYIKDLNLEGLDIPKQKLDKLFEVNPADWKDEMNEVKSFLGQFSSRLPKEIAVEAENL